MIITDRTYAPQAVLGEGMEEAFTPVETRSDIRVDLIGYFGGDWLVCDAARVSTKGMAGIGYRDISEKRDVGLIHSLMRHRHTAPFQHGSLTFYVEAPIFVFREWRTHRIAMVMTTDDFSYSESSARYRPMDPQFWVPGPERPVVNFGTQMEPEFRVKDRNDEVGINLDRSYMVAWHQYQKLLKMKVAPEVARAALPVSVYSSMYVTCNPLSLMHFVSLRTHEKEAAYISYPQWEIEVAAREMEKVLQYNWPVTYAAFNEYGRMM